MMFHDESERQRAREAAVATWGMFSAFPDVYLREWDKKFPPIADAPKWPEMSSGGVSGTMPPGTMAFNATPSPAFAAAVLAFGNAECDCGLWEEDDEDMPHPYQHYLDIANAARTALVRVHLEEVNNAIHG